MSEKHRGLCALCIGNFKAFAETQYVPIRPLTIIYGANSSGKSSLIHSLLLANHALENGNVDVHQTRIGGDSVDLGGFHQFVHGHDLKRRCHWGMKFSHKPLGPLVKFLGGFTKTAIHFEIGVPEGKAQGSEGRDVAEIQSIEIDLDDSKLLRMERGLTGHLYPVAVSVDHPVLRNAIEKVVEHLAGQERMHRYIDGVSDDMDPAEAARNEARSQSAHEQEMAKWLHRLDEIHSAIEQEFKQLPFSVEHFLPLCLVPEGEEDDYAYTYGASDAQATLDNFNSEYEGPALVARILRMEIEALFKLMKTGMHKRLQDFCYLGPLRCYPPRHLTGMHDRDPNWFAGGGQAWETLKRNPSVLQKVNHWLTARDRLAKPYKIVLRDLVDLATITPTLRTHLEDALGRLTANPEISITKEVESALKDVALSKNASEFSEIILEDNSGTHVSHRDVGQGISQVLPILVNAFALEKHIIAVEQPELHLHPALQAELGDVFIDSALGEQHNKVLIESHSEHLLLRIMRRIRQTHEGTLPKDCAPVSPEDVAILYVEPVGTRSIVREMPLNERGDLIKDWPGGFFEEGLREVLM